MVIFTKDIDYDFLASKVGSPDAVLEYVKNLVPNWALCFPNIVDNQCYYVACQIRAMLTLPYRARRSCVLSLCENISLSGISSAFITVADILNACNTETLQLLLKDLYNECNTY